MKRCLLICAAFLLALAGLLVGRASVFVMHTTLHGGDALPNALPPLHTVEAVISPAQQGGLLDLNTATAAELEELPGIGPALAARIVDYRTTHGPFETLAEVQSVDGIGPATFTEIEPFLTIN